MNPVKKCVNLFYVRISIAVILTIFQIVFLIVRKFRLVEYTFGLTFFLINAVIILFVFWSLFHIKHRTKKQYILYCILIVLTILNSIGLYRHIVTIREKVCYAPNYENAIVVNQNIKSGQTIIYRMSFFLFAVPVKILYFNSNNSDTIKIQWLTTNICRVTYAQDDGQIQQYNYIYHPNNLPQKVDLISSLKGLWETGDHQTKLVANTYGIMITSNHNKTFFNRKSCKQIDSSILELSSSGMQKWTIAILTKNSVIEKIILCSVSMNQNSPIVLSPEQDLSIDTIDSIVDPTSASVPPTICEKNGETIAQRMSEALKKTPNLSEFEPGLSAVKVIADSNDPFWIGRLADEEVYRQFLLYGIYSYVQINHMEILAGTEKEFLIKIDSSEYYTGSDTVGLSQTYRIKEGRGAYLAVRIPDEADGTKGLKILSSPKTRNTKWNKNYEFHFSLNGNSMRRASDPNWDD